METETIYVLYNTETGLFYKDRQLVFGRYQDVFKTWKTLSGAVKALEKIKNKQGLQVKLLSVKDINE